MTIESKAVKTAFLYTQAGVNEDLNVAARAQLEAAGVPFREIDLTNYRLDNEWPGLPVVSSRLGFVGGFDPETLEAHVAMIEPSRQPRT